MKRIKLIWRIIELMKTKLIKFLRIIIYFFIIFLILFFQSISYKDILSLSFMLIILFTFISLTFYTFKEDREDRKLLINIWKMYAPSILLLYSSLFSIYNFISNQEIDFMKTELNYNIELRKDENNQNIKDIYNSYKKKMEEQKEIFDKRYIIEIKNFKEYMKIIYNKKYQSYNIKPNSNGDNYIFWWANPILLIINLLTLFMFMRLINELNLKKRVINYSINLDIIQKLY